MENKKLIEVYKLSNKYDLTYREVFYEESTNKIYNYLNNKLENIEINILNGIGVTLAKDNFKVYGCTNDFDDVPNIIQKLGKNFKESDKKFNEIKSNTHNNNYSHNYLSNEDKKKLMSEINEYIQSLDSRIFQVKIILKEENQLIKVIANNKLSEEKRVRTRLSVIILGKQNDIIASVSYSPGYIMDYTMLKSINYKKDLEEKINELKDQLSTVNFKGGLMPVIIESGFGAVIFHEACGHAMESSSIVENTSIMCNKLEKKVASNKVTIVDDGTLGNYYGTSRIDDQGNQTKKNVLIENGILKKYLTDINDALILNKEVTGSARRENYHFPASSRMNNTYLNIGIDNIDEMINSTEYGLYAKTFSGGSVNPTTGEFNFTVSLGYIINHGKITKPVKNISLIGDAFTTLNNIESVSNNLKLESGICGSISGNIPVTCGQPTIKVSEILVGGSNE